MAEKIKHPIYLPELTAEQAIQITIDMWTDMMDELGENPTFGSRSDFKDRWILDHGYPSASTWWKPNYVNGNCFLCEYAVRKKLDRGDNKYNYSRCACCPIVWPTERYDCKSAALDYRYSPIPDILAYIEDKKNWREE